MEYRLVAVERAKKPGPLLAPATVEFTHEDLRIELSVEVRDVPGEPPAPPFPDMPTVHFDGGDRRAWDLDAGAMGQVSRDVRAALAAGRDDKS